MPTDLPGPGVWLSDRDCALIVRALRLGLAHLVGRDGVLPAGVAEVEAAIVVHAAAERFRQERPRSAVGSGTALGLREVPAAPSAANGWISTQEVAQWYGVSESYVRRLARERRLLAQRTGRGTWRCDAASVAAWAATRHTEAA